MIKSRDRGFTGGEVLVGMAAAQLGGEDFLVGLDRRCDDVAGEVLAPVAGLSSTTAAGLARTFTDGAWHAVETGIGDIQQLEYLHLDPRKARELHEGAFDWTVDVRGVVGQIAETRRQIAEVELGEDPIAALEYKRALLEDASARRDACSSSLISSSAPRWRGARNRVGSRDPHLRAEMETDQRVSRDGLFFEAVAVADKVAASEGELEARQKRMKWLATDRVDGAFDREPLHWPLVFAEVFEGGGFDAVVGNPPFLGGQKLTGSLGTAYREHLVAAIGSGARGSADLVASFVLRAHDVLNGGGQTGLIATNTLAQGDTREVGLDQLVDGGVTIRQSVKSKPWPSKSAALEYCAVWTSRAMLGEGSELRADGVVVAGVTPPRSTRSRGWLGIHTG